MNHGTPNRLIQPLSVDVMRPVADGDCKDYALPTATTGLEARSHGTAKSKAQQRTEEKRTPPYNAADGRLPQAGQAGGPRAVETIASVFKSD